jgi:hypothetical protein
MGGAVVAVRDFRIGRRGADADIRLIPEERGREPTPMIATVSCTRSTPREDTP